MKCDEARNMMPEYVDGELAPERAEQIRLHIDGCAECRREYAEQKRLVDAIRNLPRKPAPAGFAEGVNRQLNRGTAFYSHLRRYGSMAAAIVLTIGAAALMMRNHGRDCSHCFPSTAPYESVSEYKPAMAEALDEEMAFVFEETLPQDIPSPTLAPRSREVATHALMGEIREPEDPVLLQQRMTVPGLRPVQFYLNVFADEPEQSASQIAELLKEEGFRVLSEQVFRGPVLNVSKVEDGRPVGLKRKERARVMEIISDAGKRANISFSESAVSNTTLLYDEEAEDEPMHLIIYVTRQKTPQEE